MDGISFDQNIAQLEARTKLAVVSIWAVIGTGAAMAVGELMEMAGMVHLEEPAPDALSTIVGLVYLSNSLAFLLSAVLVGMWIYRAHANLTAVMEDLEFSPGWSVGWFFVPIANLFKPAQAMRELWNASQGTSNSYGEESPASVKAWWGCYIGGNILGVVGMRMDNMPSGAGLAMGALVGAVGTALLFASAWYLLRILEEVLAAQRNHLGVVEAFA